MEFYEQNFLTSENAIIMNVNDPNCFTKVFQQTLDFYAKEEQKIKQRAE